MAVNQDIPLGRVINVSIEGVPVGLARTNMNIVCLMTSDKSFLNSNKRTVSYTELSGVADDFGSYSKVYQLAKRIFTNANPINKGKGYLVIGYWRATDEVIDATKGYLKSAELSEAVIVDTLQTIKDGSFTININDAETPLTVTDINFSSCTSLSDIVALLNTKITGSTVTLNGLNQIIITSNLTGSSSTVSFMSDTSTGTGIADVLCLSNGSGAVSVDGKASETLDGESKEQALIEVSKEEPIRGVVYIDKPTSNEAKAISTWATANDCLVYDVFSDEANFTLDMDNNFVWSNKLTGGVNYRTLFDKQADRGLAVGYMAKMHTVNFEATNTALTMNLKELQGCLPSKYSDSELNSAQKVGLDLYGTFGSLPRTYTSGANDFTDNVYNVIAIKKFVQIDVFNTLQGTPTKLAQTDEDMQKLIDTVERTLDLFVRAGVIAPGTWNSTYDFGNPEVFRKNIATTGYYVYAKPMSEQAQSEREQRKAPAIQVAFKMAGAIHTADIAIVFER
ncbi:DUF3383 family protein [Aliarcobacter butzleri]